MAEANPFRFSTKYLDSHDLGLPETACQLYYFGYRHYDAITGRWLSRDPLNEQGGLNLYAYCSNDPVNAVDPLGLDYVEPQRVGDKCRVIWVVEREGEDWLQVPIGTAAIQGRKTKAADKVYIEGDPGNKINQANKVHWLDRYAGWRAFGYDRTYDIFTKLHWKIDSYKFLNFSHWVVDSKFQTFNPWNTFYEDGKNVNHKYSQRFHLEFRHQLSEKTYYTVSASRFTQEMKIDVEGSKGESIGA